MALIDKVYNALRLNNDEDYDDEYDDDTYDNDECDINHNKKMYHIEKYRRVDRILKKGLLILFGGCALFFIEKTEIALPFFFITIVLFLWNFAEIVFYKDDDLTGKKIDTYREYLISSLTNKEEKENRYLLEGEVADNKDIIALMLKNNDEITEYFKISKSQAKTSYLFSIIACSVGIMLLLVSIIGVFVIKKMEMAVISLISGSITEVVAGTVLWVHNKSALQLNHYYNALHENEKFLSAVKLVEKINRDGRDEMYKEIIRKQIEKNTKNIKDNEGGD